MAPGHLSALTGCVVSHFSASAECFVPGGWKRSDQWKLLLGGLQVRRQCDDSNLCTGTSTHRLYYCGGLWYL